MEVKPFSTDDSADDDVVDVDVSVFDVDDVDGVLKNGLGLVFRLEHSAMASHSL